MEARPASLLGPEQLPHRAADPVTTITTNWRGGVQPFLENLWDQELGVQWLHTHTRSFFFFFLVEFLV